VLWFLKNLKNSEKNQHDIVQANAENEEKWILFSGLNHLNKCKKNNKQKKNTVLR